MNLRGGRDEQVHGRGRDSSAEEFRPHPARLGSDGRVNLKDVDPGEHLQRLPQTCATLEVRTDEHFGEGGGGNAQPLPRRSKVFRLLDRRPVVMEQVDEEAGVQAAHASPPPFQQALEALPVQFASCPEEGADLLQILWGHVLP